MNTQQKEEYDRLVKEADEWTEVVRDAEKRVDDASGEIERLFHGLGCDMRKSAAHIIFDEVMKRPVLISELVEILSSVKEDVEDIHDKKQYEIDARHEASAYLDECNRKNEQED